jgi:hypothetical protein
MFFKIIFPSVENCLISNSGLVIFHLITYFPYFPLVTNKFKEFQWKCLHNINYTEHRLKKMNLSNGRCHLCQIRDFHISHFEINITVLKMTSKSSPPYSPNIIFNSFISILTVNPNCVYYNEM